MIEWINPISIHAPREGSDKASVIGCKSIM